MSQVEDGPGCAEGRWALDFLFRGNGQNSSQPLLWRWGTEDADLLFSFTRPWDLKDKRLYKIEEGTTHLVENILLFSFGNNYKKKGVKVRFFLCLLVLFLCIEKVWAKGRGPLYAASGLNITDANTATSAGLWLNEQLIMLKLMLNAGMTRVRLLTVEEEIEKDGEEYLVQSVGVEVEASDTTYWCSVHRSDG